MRPITYALIASLVGATVLSGCTNAGESTNDTGDQLDTNITVTPPACTGNTTYDNTTGTCVEDNSTSTNSTNSTG